MESSSLDAFDMETKSPKIFKVSHHYTFREVRSTNEVYLPDYCSESVEQIFAYCCRVPRADFLSFSLTPLVALLFDFTDQFCFENSSNKRLASVDNIVVEIM